jgi:serine/threonine-protein kinase
MNPARPEVTGEPPFSSTETAEIRAYLDHLLRSGPFGGSARKAQLLRYLVERTLAGKQSEITEYAIGLDVFEKPASFDPRIDSAVRAEVSRLRQRLKEYYALEGRGDSIVIDFPQRTYVPGFSFRQPEPAEPVKKNRWWFAAALIGIAMLLGGGFALWRTRSVKPNVDSLVVLPFANLSSDPTNEYIADGLTEELTNELAQWPDLRVVARTSAFQFKGKAADVREIGKRLNVEAVLEGSFDKQGDKIRVTAQLNRASNGYHLWSKAYEVRAADIMALQDEMARSIAESVRGVGRKAAPLVSSTSSPEAHDLFLQANFEFSKRTPEATKKSLALFRAALEKDPSYVTAYRGIARADITLIHLTVIAPRVGFEEARQALEKALSINPHDAETLGQLADLHYLYDWDWPRAEREFREAIAQGAQATTHSYYGWSLATRGRFQEAHQQLDFAQDLDPLNAGPRFNQTIAYLLERRYADAKLILRGMIDSNLSLLDSHLILGGIAAYEHNCDEAVTNFEWAARAYQAPVTTQALASAAICRGQNDRARELLAKAESENAFVSPYQLAMDYASLGDKDRAFSYLNKSAEAKEGQIFYIRYEPAFDGIRSDRRFTALERLVRLID